MLLVRRRLYWVRVVPDPMVVSLQEEEGTHGQKKWLRKQTGKKPHGGGGRARNDMASQAGQPSWVLRAA
jgi:hypothetical protein